MPKRRYTKKRRNPAARRTNVRRFPRRTRKRRTYISRAPFQKRIFTQLQYKCRVLDTSTGILTVPNLFATAVVYQSSPFDPQNAVGGHQPMFYDNLSLIYKSYRCYGFSYKITVLTASSTTAGVEMCIRHQSTSTLSASIDVAREQPRAKTIIVPPFASGAYRIIKGYVDIAKVFGITKRDFLGDDSFQSLVSANPAEMAYLVMYLQTLGPVALDVHMTLELTYYLEFFDMKEIAQS